MPRFLVVERDIVVAEDLSAILSLHVPGAQVIHAASIAEASERLGEKVDLVFVSSSRDQAALAALADAAEQRGGRIVITGGAPPIDGHLSIHSPFTARSVTALLDSL